MLNKMAVALRLLAVGLLAGVQGCSMTVNEAVATSVVVFGSQQFGRFPPRSKKADISYNLSATNLSETMVGHYFCQFQLPQQA